MPRPPPLSTVNGPRWALVAVPPAAWPPARSARRSPVVATMSPRDLAVGLPRFVRILVKVGPNWAAKATLTLLWTNMDLLCARCNKRGHSVDTCA